MNPNARSRFKNCTAITHKRSALGAQPACTLVHSCCDSISPTESRLYGPKAEALGRSGCLLFHARKRQRGKSFSSKGRRKKCTFYPHTAVHRKRVNKPEPKHQSRAGSMHEPPCNKLQPKHLAPASPQATTLPVASEMCPRRRAKARARARSASLSV